MSSDNNNDSILFQTHEAFQSPRKLPLLSDKPNKLEAMHWPEIWLGANLLYLSRQTSVPKLRKESHCNGS